MTRIANGLSRQLTTVCVLVCVAASTHAQVAPTHHSDETVSVSISAEKTVLQENEDSSIELVVESDRPVTDRLTVQLTTGGTATRDLDYELETTQVIFKDGDEAATIRLLPIRDWVWEGDETIEIEVGRFLGNGQAGNPGKVEITLEDDEKQPEDGEPETVQVRYLSDISVFNYMRIEEDTVRVAIIAINPAAVDSQATSVTTSLYEDTSFKDPILEKTMDVPSLESSRRSAFSAWVEIPLENLKPSSTYYGQALVETYEGEAYTYNNDSNFGFTLNEIGEVVAQCTRSNSRQSTGTDPLLSEQWYIHNDGQKSFAANPATPGEDLHMRDTMAAEITGRDIQIAVVDTGLEICHPDLHDNIEPDASFNFLAEPGLTNSVFGSTATDPFNPETWGDHGTSIAGLAAGMANNAIGIRGIAPNAKLRGFNYLASFLPNSAYDSLGGSLSNPNSTDVDVFNMSYGATVWRKPDIDLYRLFEFGTAELRDGNGSIYVKSAGNGWRSCNFIFHPIHRGIGCKTSSIDYLNRLPYILVIGALDADSKPAPYSSRGSNLWVSAPAGWWGRNQPALLTTDQIGSERGYHHWRSYGLRPGNQLSQGDFISTFNGTSGSAAIVSGIVALLLEANPELTWRDIKHILAKSARQVHLDSPPTKAAIGNDVVTLMHEWQLNGAGYAYHERYGFGAIDVDHAIELIQTYKADSLGRFQKSDWLEPNRAVFDRIPDADGKGVTIEIDVEFPRKTGIQLEPVKEAFANSNIEMVHLRVEFTHDDISELGVTLTSPSGMKSIVNPIFNNALPRDYFRSETLVFASSEFYGESPVGTWQVHVLDASEGNTGRIFEVEILFYYGEHP